MSLARIIHKKKKDHFVHLMRGHFSKIVKIYVALGTQSLLTSYSVIVVYSVIFRVSLVIDLGSS